MLRQNAPAYYLYTGAFSTLDLAENGLKLSRTHYPGLAPFHFSFAKYDQGWNALHLESIGCSGVFINVYLKDGDVVFQILFHLVKNRCHHLAGTTPFCEEVDQYWFVSLDHFLELAHV